MPSKVTVATPSASAWLTTLSRVKTELGITGLDDDAFLNVLIAQSSEEVERIVGRPLMRTQYTETMKGSRTVRQTLSRLPVVSLESVTYDGTAITVTDFSIEDGEAGFVYYANGFTKTADPTDWVFTYTAGYVLLESTTFSAAASDDSYNDSASGFGLLRADEVITGEGWTDPANNGPKLIATSAAGKITTGSALVDESAGSTRVLRSLPGPIERACIGLVKSAFERRERESDVSSIKVGDFTINYAPAEIMHAHRELSRWMMY